MITKCIVSAYTSVCRVAVLFDSRFCNCIAKSLLLVSILLLPYSVKAELTGKNWYGANDYVIESINTCNSVYSITLTPANDGQLELTHNGKNVNGSNTVFASDKPSSVAWKKGDPTSDAVNFITGSSDPITFYFIEGETKDTIAFTKPTYSKLGVGGSGYENMNLDTEPTFTPEYCSVSASEFPADATFQWQSYDKKGDSWVDIEDAVNKDYSPAAGTLADSTRIRVVMTSGGDKMTSSSVLAYYHKPGVKLEISGTEIFETKQKPTYENEIDYGNSFTIEVKPLGASSVTEFTLKYRSDNDEEFVELANVSSGNSYTVTPSKNLEYQVVAKGVDMRPGHEGEVLTMKDTFFVRVRFSWDEGAEVDTLFFDNFGVFNSSTEYVTSNNLSFSDELTDTVGVSNQIVNYWAPDYFNSVKNHEFSLLNPLVGPFDGDCAADNYKHYACWGGNGGCDGYRIEDGYYAIVPNPDYSNCGQTKKDYWNGYDHTEEATGVLGGMLFVNCADKSKETAIIEREITLSNKCENTRLLFSAYVNNATAVAENKPVNVRLKVLDQNDNVIYETPSGDIYPRSVKGGMWANLSFMFTASEAGKYKLQVVNNQPGGADNFGNDLLFDDILIIAAYPTVNVYSDRSKSQSSMSPIDTCAEVTMPLYLLNKDDIKKYITTPNYLYQYSKDSINWVNLGEITDVDSFNITLDKQTPLYWDTTYFRGIVASNETVINHILEGNAPVLSCDSVYAISAPYRVVFDYGGPLDPTYHDTLCVGETFTVTVDAHKRPVYRWVDSHSLETINNQDLTFTYTVAENDPVDTLFYFVTETRLGCTDTMEVKVHRRSFVEFNVPDSFIVCLYDSAVQLTNVVPANAEFDWTYSATQVEHTTVPSNHIPAGLAHNGRVFVKGTAKDYCETKKSFPYLIFEPIKVVVEADRTDSLFCLSAPDSKFKLTANTVSGEPATYFWTKNGEQVGFSKAPVNYYEFGALSEGKTEFGVLVVDEVCNKSGVSEFATGIPTELREPITVDLTAVSRICENEVAEAQVQFNHLLKPEGTDVFWAVATGNATLASETTKSDAAQHSSNVVTPASLTNTTEQIVVAVSTTDKVCPNNVPTANATIDLYKSLDITVTTDRSDSLFCMTNTGITFKAVTNRGYVKDFFWFADGVQVEKTGNDVSTYTFPVATEGKHYYGVHAVDGVCNVRDSNEYEFSVPIETRLPITISLSANEKICEDATATAEVTLEHLLDPNNTSVFWAVTTGNGTLTGETTNTVDSKSTNVVTPVSLTATTEQIFLAASVADKVCTENIPATNTTIDLYKKLDVVVSTDRTDHLFCMGGNTGITFTAVTNRGFVNQYNWFADNELIGSTDNSTPTFTFPVTAEGQHVYGVKMIDGVCSVDGDELPFEYVVETRQPITFSLKANEAFCETSGLAVIANFEHLLQNPTEVVWTVTANGKLFAEKTYTDGDSTVNSISALPVSATKETVTIAAQIADYVCPENSPVVETITSEMHKNVVMSLITDNINGTKCLNEVEDAEIGLTVLVERGNPAYFIWSDGVVDDTIRRKYTLALGDNIISVDAYDSVCVSNAPAATANNTVTTRVPLNVNLVMTKGSNPICVGNEVDFAAVVDNNFPGDEIIYTWQPNESSTSAMTYRPLPGNNDVKVGVIAANAICPVQIANYMLSVQDSVKIGIEATPFLCQDQDSSQSVTLRVDVYAGNPQMFVWSTGDTTIDNYTFHNPTKNTVYSVYAVDRVCANSFAVYTPVVEVSNLFTIDVKPETDKVQMGEDVKFNVTIPEGYTGINLAWYMINQNNDTLFIGTSTEEGFSYPMPLNGEYTFYSTAVDGYCGVLQSFNVGIDVADYYQVPNAFTPYNGNIKNDVFMKGYPVKIFNRYQQMVYEGVDGWNGEYNGQLAEPGTYFYILEKKDGRTLKGTIELVKF